MVEKKESEASGLVSSLLKEEFNVTLIKHDYFSAKLGSNQGKKPDRKTVLQIVYNAPIEEVSPSILTNLLQLLFSTTSLDDPLDKSTYLSKPLLVEIKNVTNVSKPFQKVKDAELDDGEKEMKIGPKKGQMFSMIAHDGVRFLKLVLLFKDTKSLIAKINESNKFILSAGIYVTKGDGATQFLIDDPSQIQ